VTKVLLKLLLYHITVEREYIYRERKLLERHSNYYYVKLLLSKNVTSRREFHANVTESHSV